MTETTEAPEAVSASPKVKKAVAKKAGKKAGTASTHPPIAQMVTAAVRELKEKGGSSTQAIKKYISATYKVDVEKKSKFIAKYLKSAVASGSLVQTKGKGASGSFKLPGGGDSKPKKDVKKKAKAATPKKPAATKKKAAPKAASKPKPKKASPTKAKKAKKPPTTPKPPKAKAATKTKPKTSKSTTTKPKTPKKKPAAASRKKASPKKK